MKWLQSHAGASIWITCLLLSLATPALGDRASSGSPHWDSTNSATKTDGSSQSAQKVSGVVLSEGEGAYSGFVTGEIASGFLESAELRRVVASGDKQLLEELGITRDVAREIATKIAAPVPSCSLTPVVGAQATFIPVSVCGSPHTYLSDVSNNRVVVGGFETPSQDKRAFRFQVVNNNIVGLTVLKDTAVRPAPETSYPLKDTYALGISADGTKIVGSGCPEPCTSATRLRALRWDTPLSNPRVLPSASGVYPGPNENQIAEAAATNATGAVIAGTNRVTTYLSSRAARWTVSGSTFGFAQLGNPGISECAMPPCASYARGITADGRGMVGFLRYAHPSSTSSFYFPTLPFLHDWTAGNYVQIPRIPGVVSRAAPGTQVGFLQASGLADLAARSVLPRAKALGVAPDGWAVVGQDANGEYSFGSHGQPLDPTYPLRERLDSEQPDLAPIPFGTYGFEVTDSNLGTIGGFVQTVEGFRWRPSALYSPAGTHTAMGDITDTHRPPTQQFNFSFSRINDSSNGGCRVVGQAYAGREGSTLPTTTQATVRPWLATSQCDNSANCTTGACCRKMALLKDQTNRLLTASQKHVDINNSGGARWLLTEATAISADGRVIVGNARCSADGGVKRYGFVVVVNTP